MQLQITTFVSSQKPLSVKNSNFLSQLLAIYCIVIPFIWNCMYSPGLCHETHFTAGNYWVELINMLVV